MVELHPAWGAPCRPQTESTAPHLDGLRVLLQPVINLRHGEGRLALLDAVTGEKRRRMRRCPGASGRREEMRATSSLLLPTLAAGPSGTPQAEQGPASP